MTGAVSGSVGNVVFSRNRYGPLMRVRAMPVFGESEYRDEAKSALAEVMALWATLDDSERDAWDTAASLRPERDALGGRIVLQGSDLFCRCNIRASQAGGEVVRVPVCEPDPGPVGGLSVAATSSPTVVNVSWTSGGIPEGQAIQIWVAVLKSAGRRYYRNLLKRICEASGPVSGPIDVGPDVEARFWALETGHVVKVHCYLVGALSGYRSPFTIASCVVDA